MGDVPRMHGLLQEFAGRGLLLPRSLSSLYDQLRDFVVYEEEGRVLGVCALHICWENLAEIRSLGVEPWAQGRGIGSRLVQSCLDEARLYEITRVFTLTYRPGFFARLGFREIDKQTLPHKVWSECIHCPHFPDCSEHALLWTDPRAGGAGGG